MSMVSANCGMCGDESLGLIVQNGKTYKKFIKFPSRHVGGRLQSTIRLCYYKRCNCLGQFFQLFCTATLNSNPL